MSIPYWSRPWLDGAEEHYRDDEPEDWSGMTDELDDEEQDDHDRRYDDYYSEQNGDIGDEAMPPY